MKQKKATNPRNNQANSHATKLQAIDNWLKKEPGNTEEREAQALTALIVETGMKVTETVRLRDEDLVSWKKLRVRAKDGTERTVTYGERTIRHFLTWYYDTGLRPCLLGEDYIHDIIWKYAAPYTTGAK